MSEDQLRALELIAEAVRGLSEGLTALARAVAVSPVAAGAAADDVPLAPLVRKKRLAEFLGVSEVHIDRLNPPFIVVGDAGTKRYDVAAVLDWLKRREPAPASPTTRPAAHDVDTSLGLRRAKKDRDKEGKHDG